MFEFTMFVKPPKDGPLSKRIKLDGRELVSDGSACVMGEGDAVQVKLDGIEDFAKLLNAFSSQHALALGRLPDRVLPATPPAPGAAAPVVKVVSERNLGAHPGAIARNKKTLTFAQGEQALALIDYDQKGMPQAVRERIEHAGGVWEALEQATPELKNVARVIRPSTSSGISRSDTGQQFPSSGGVHVYLLVSDGSDIPRFIAALHDAMWLAGLGWYVIAKDGSLLERSVVDRMVGSPERLVFEGAPVLEPPLVQDVAAREARAVPGDVLDTRPALPDLTPGQQAQLRLIKEQAKQAIAADAAAVRDAYDMENAKAIAGRTGCPVSVALSQARMPHDGKLPPSWVLDFDDPGIGFKTVAEVQADPPRYVGETLSDPIEGPTYGRGKAMVMGSESGGYVINSFAHGHRLYRLVHDEATLLAVCAATDAKYVLEVVADAMIDAELSGAAYASIKDAVRKKAGVGFRDFTRAVKDARERRRKREREAHEARTAFLDPRMKMEIPAFDAELMASVRPIDAALSTRSGDATDPPLRGVDGEILRVVNRSPTKLHELGSHEAAPDGSVTSRRAPPVPTLEAQKGAALRMFVESYVRFVKIARNGATTDVALFETFVLALSAFRESAIPVCEGVQPVPLVMQRRKLIAPVGYDPDTCLFFCVDPELLALLPQPVGYTLEAAQASWKFLTEDWLADVATTKEGKAICVAMLASIVERHLLAEQPAYIASAGMRGSGKTTALNMVSTAALGVSAAAASWSGESEERRKALFSAAREGVPLLVFDNTVRGTVIDCPHINAFLTSAAIRDRILGVSETAEYPASTVLAVTGNNVAAKGDFSSRALVIDLDTGRANPEGRAFRHADPIGWTRQHRNEILAALYTILMVPRPSGGQARTRFKNWWRLVGQPIEVVSGVDFAAILTGREQAEDAETVGTRILFEAFRTKFRGKPFKATDVLPMLDPNHGPDVGAAFTGTPAEQKAAREAAGHLREALEAASGKKLPPGAPSAAVVGKHLTGLKNRAVLTDEGMTNLQINARRDRIGVMEFWIVERDADGAEVI